MQYLVRDLLRERKKLHQHPLSQIYHRDGVECDVCDRSYRRGLSCEVCKVQVHRKCSFVFRMPPILYEHPSHDGHAKGIQLLTTGAPPFSDPECHICGKDIKRILYHCNTCNLNMHIDCMFGALCIPPDGNSPRHSPLQFILHCISGGLLFDLADQSSLKAIMDVLPVITYGHMSWHSHPLLKIGDDMLCDVCRRSAPGYFCITCRFMVHEECVGKFEKLSEITSHCHAKHPLKLLTGGAPSYTDPECHICGDDFGNLLYHCDICKFNLDFKCASETPPEVTLSNLKVHEHTLTLIPRLISFVCDACGMKGDRAPYVCLQCNFMVHQRCARLPRVIYVNRHDHRVSYTYPIGLGEWKCEICLEEVDWSCGAYSCALCRPTYVVHSRCATTEDVWDGIELDGRPEEVEDVEPFKINDDNTITHFAHDQHNMSLNKDGIALEESIFCGACVRPISSDTFYNCSDCSFILHETCANLPKKKRLFLNPAPLKLNPHSTSLCYACFQRHCTGFMYEDKDHWKKVFDLICSSITIPFTHGSHPDHPLVFIKLQDSSLVKTCRGCNTDTRFDVIGCTKCNYFLDFRCATLPTKVRLERYDDHSLILCYGEKASGKYWCDICERETNPETWFYTCEDCGVSLHIFCVIGDIRYAKPGGKIERRTPDAQDIELVPNNRSSRPFCNHCDCRCPGPFILKLSLGSFMCSYYCYGQSILRMYSDWTRRICPPWIGHLEQDTW